MLQRLVLAMAAVWLGLAGAPGGGPAWAEASADQMNKLSLESLTAGSSGGGGYRPAPHHSYARHYARYAPRRSFARRYPRTRHGRIQARHAYAGRPHAYAGARRHPAYHHARRYRR